MSQLLGSHLLAWLQDCWLTPAIDMRRLINVDFDPASGAAASAAKKISGDMTAAVNVG